MIVSINIKSLFNSPQEKKNGDLHFAKFDDFSLVLILLDPSVVSDTVYYYHLFEILFVLHLWGYSTCLVSSIS